MIDTTSHDDIQRRCPRLGSIVRFHYCRTSGDAPCFKVLDCWWELFDVAACLRQSLPPEVFARLAATPPPDKVTSLVALIRQAQERMGKTSPS